MEALSAVLVQIVVLVLTGVVTAALAALRSYLKTKLSSQQYELLDQLANAAVWAVEQQGPGPFTTKKAAATSAVEDQLAEHGIKDMPRTSIDTAIEAAVGTNFNYRKLSGDLGVTGE